MGSLHELRNRVADTPDSLGAGPRSRRWEWLQVTFPKIESMSVIDLGGTVDSWLRAPVRPASVRVVSLAPAPRCLADWIRADQADACSLPAHISGGSYDLVVSESLIGHVGGHAQRVRLADAVHSLADRHWVQAPYRYFPVDPHWLFPWFQFLPPAVRAEVARWWPPAQVRLLSRAEMACYFPDSTLQFERTLGVIRSIAAVRT